MPIPVDPPDVPDQWDSFIARIDDAPASVMLNFGYRGRTPVAGATHIYWCDIEMADPQPHGMGGDTDFAALRGVEDRIASRLSGHGVHLVARIRGNGYWQIRLFAPPGLDQEVARAAEQELADGAREVHVGSQENADWTYYDDFLYPNAERLRWMRDRDLVDALEQGGDQLAAPRVVEHFVRFREQSACAAFRSAAAGAGFESAGESRTDDGAWPWSVMLTRTDPVELGHIHEVVMTLAMLAEEHGGDYDGWGTNVSTE